MDIGKSIKICLWKFVMILILILIKVTRETNITSAFRVAV